MTAGELEEQQMALLVIQTRQESTGVTASVATPAAAAAGTDGASSSSSSSSAGGSGSWCGGTAIDTAGASSSTAPATPVGMDVSGNRTHSFALNCKPPFFLLMSDNCVPVADDTYRIQRKPAVLAQRELAAAAAAQRLSKQRERD
jgi:hypothetical protein